MGVWYKAFFSHSLFRHRLYKPNHCAVSGVVFSGCGSHLMQWKWQAVVTAAPTKRMKFVLDSMYAHVFVNDFSFCSGQPFWWTIPSKCYTATDDIHIHTYNTYIGSILMIYIYIEWWHWVLEQYSNRWWCCEQLWVIEVFIFFFFIKHCRYLMAKLEYWTECVCT